MLLQKIQVDEANGEVIHLTKAPK